MDAQTMSDKSSHLIHAVGIVRRKQDRAFLEIEEAFRPALAQLKPANAKDLPLILRYIYQTWRPRCGYEGEIPLILFAYGDRPPDSISETVQQVYVPLI
jgi:hypothetical protein